MLLQRRRASHWAPKQGHCSKDTSNLLIKQLLCAAAHGAETSLEGEGGQRDGWGASFFFVGYEQQAKHTLC